MASFVDKVEASKICLSCLYIFSVYSCLHPFFLEFFSFPGIQEIFVEFLILTSMTVNVFLMRCDPPLWVLRSISNQSFIFLWVIFFSPGFVLGFLFMVATVEDLTNNSAEIQILLWMLILIQVKLKEYFLRQWMLLYLEIHGRFNIGFSGNRVRPALNSFGNQTCNFLFKL